MKVGDLVRYSEIHQDPGLKEIFKSGLVLEGPRKASVGLQYRVWWPYQNKTGWWDEFRLDVINAHR